MQPDGKVALTYLINEVARWVGLSQKRIREYEKSGLIKPQREPRTNNRRYTEADIAQILRVKALIHEHGFTLACLKYFLAAAPCWIIFDCPQKNACPIHGTTGTPCYDLVRNADGRMEPRMCDRCPVYLNRHEDKMALLEKP
jgi:MerR family transcriptional regulator, repressor of the yfmOP operon